MSRAAELSLVMNCDEALKSLEEEAKLQGVWDQLLIVQSSEFARTAESNGGGSDHAW